MAHPKKESKVVDLVEIIDNKLNKVHTQSLDLSFNELLDMQKTGELNISPDFQRLFRWSEGSRSRFIESLLLEMPVPPLYVIEEQNGSYSLIDGLQRLSSYLHFRGDLDAPHLEPAVKKGQMLTLNDCDIIKELNGKSWNDLGTALQIKLKRTFVRVEVVRKGSDPRFKYHMFKRLNTGGALLSTQQLRNCTIRLLSPVFNEFIIRLSRTENFKNCISTITDEQTLSAFDQELVLRFFALKNARNNFKHDVADFLTDYMENISDPEIPLTFGYVAEEKNFLKTFKILDNSLGDSAFGYANKQKNNINKGFGVYHFEAITLGIQAIIDNLDEESETNNEQLRDAIYGIKYDDHFIKMVTGGGKNSPGQLRTRINFVEDKLSQIKWT